MASSVQFKGVDGVVSAYKNRDVAPWSLWQGKQFMFKFEGNDIEDGAAQLEETLTLLAQSSNAVYTLKVYEDLPGGKIKSNTPDDGSFNFKINGDEQMITQSQYSSLKYSNNIADRLEAIEQRLSEKDEEGEDEPDNKLGMIGDIISHPVLAPIVQSFFTGLFSKKSDAAAPTQSPIPRAAINGINDEERLNAVVKELQQYDPNLLEHLTKLAGIAKESPQSFTFLLSTLDNL